MHLRFRYSYQERHVSPTHWLPAVSVHDGTDGCSELQPGYHFSVGPTRHDTISYGRFVPGL